MSKFLKKFDLQLFNFEITSAQGGSLRVYASKNPKIINTRKINNQITKEKDNYKLFRNTTYYKFERKINNCKKELRKILKSFENKNLNIAGYGAAAKTTTLLNYFGLSKNKMIKNIFDDNVLKQKLYLPGTSIKILSPKNLEFKKLNIIIIFAWNYSDAIIQKLKKNKVIKNQKIKFLVPFPKPKLIQ